MFKINSALAIISILVALQGCLKDSFGPLEFKNPQTLRVMMRNSSKGSFSVNDKNYSTAVAGEDFVPAHFSNETNEPSYSFDIKRSSQPLARVSYRVLRFPTTSAEGPGDLMIVITEPVAGTFEASTPDATWIQVLSVQAL